MKRLPINADERIFLKSLEGDPAMVLLLMFHVYPTPINADNLTFEFKWDQRGNRAKKVLADLSSDGFTALMKGQGYVLTSPALRRITEFFTPIVLKQFEGHQALAHGSQAQALSPVSAGTLTVDAGLVVIEDESQLNMSTQNASALKKEEEGLTGLRIKEESTSSDSNTQNVCNSGEVEIAPGVTTARVLECSSILEGFGEEGVFTRGLQIEDIHPRMALGWLAQAYTQRETLERPAGLVYSRLKDIESPKPQAKYYEGWESYLPDDYLMAIGWLKLECDVCHAEFSKLEDLKAHETMMMVCEFGCGVRVHTAEELDAHHTTHEPKVQAFTALPTEHRGAKAWSLVIGELQNSMPKASFETWVRDTTAIAFDGKVLTVSVRNAYACDWLESRLGVNVNAMLQNYLHEVVTVSFVVGKIAEEE